LSGESFAPLFTALGENPVGHDSVSTKSIAGYGELYWKPISRLTLTLGGRYTHDTRQLDGTANLAANLALAPPGSATTFSLPVSFNKFTPRIVVAYDLDSVNLYASWNKGYKAGGFTTPAFSAPAIVKPENVDSYELGAKFVSDDRRLRANVATFYYLFKDIQVSIVDIASGGQRIENAAKARGYGLELDSNFAATNWLTLFGGLSLLDTKYLSYPNGSVSVPTATGLVAGSEDLSGDPLIHAPKSTEFLGWDLHAPIVANWTGNLNAVARHSSSYDFYPGRSGPLGNDYQRPITVANLTASVGPDSGLYSVGVYVNNLTDQRYYIQRSTSQPFGVFDQVAAPRTYGVRVVAKF
jgi:iron complex outermembrane receptor protein